MNPDILNKNIAAVNALASRVSCDVSVALIPSSAYLYRDLLPYGATQADQKSLWKRVIQSLELPSADLFQALQEHAESAIFYRTDHHWTSLGAFWGYSSLAGILGYTPRSLYSYTPETVSENFYGTAYSSSGFSWVSPDRIEIFVRESPVVTRYERSSSSAGSLYDPSKLAHKDQYSFFLGGNAPRVVIKTDKADLPKLLILRDSYADCLVPFLLEHFSEIHLLDLRYYASSVPDYIEDESVDSVLLLYGMENFCTDTSLQLLRQ